MGDVHWQSQEQKGTQVRDRSMHRVRVVTSLWYIDHRIVHKQTVDFTDNIMDVNMDRYSWYLGLNSAYTHMHTHTHTRTHAHTHTHSKEVVTCAWHPKGQLFVSADRNKKVMLWKR